MSKKETRRAARQAFPKAKTPPPKRGVYGQRTRRPVRAKSGGSSRQGAKPPSPRRAIITGILMSAIYFLLIQYAWKSGASTGANLLIAAVAFVVFAGVVYAVDRWKYRRYLNKQDKSAK